jgi:hypothetical protein
MPLVVVVVGVGGEAGLVGSDTLKPSVTYLKGHIPQCVRGQTVS